MTTMVWAVARIAIATLVALVVVVLKGKILQSGAESDLRELDIHIVKVKIVNFVFTTGKYLHSSLIIDYKYTHASDVRGSSVKV